MKSQRTITVGMVRRAYVFQRGGNGVAGYPNGLEVTWRGREDVFAPVTFLHIEHVLTAAGIRVRQARLKACTTKIVLDPGGEWTPIRCLVRRLRSST